MVRGPAVELFGHVRCTVDGVDVPLPIGKPSLLLAVLALHAGTVVTPSAVVDALWGEAPPATARALVHTYVSTLRRALAVPGGPAVGTEAGGYRLVLDPEDVDVLRLLAAADADVRGPELDTLLARAGQPFLGGVDAPGLDPWAVRIDTARDGLQLRAWHEHLDGGRAAALLPDLRAAVRADPLGEDRALLLARALGDVDRVGEALGVLDALRRALAAELGLDPSPRVDLLRRRLLAPDPSSREVEAAGARPHPDREETVAETTATAATTATATTDATTTTAPTAAPDGATTARHPLTRRRVLLGAGLLAAGAGAGAWALATRDGDLAVTGPALLEVDPERGVVAAVDLPFQPRELAVSGSRVWATSASGRAVAMVEWSGERRARVVGLSAPPSGLAAVDAVAVVGLGFSGDVVTVADGTVGAPRSAVDGASGRMTLAGGPGGVWAMTIDGVLHPPSAAARLDPPWPRPVALGRTGRRLRLDAGRAWVLGASPAEVVRVESGGDQVGVAVRGEAVDLAARGGHAWAVTSGDDRLWHVTAETGRVVGTRLLPSPPAGVAVVAGRVWVGLTAPAQLGAHGPEQLEPLVTVALPRSPVAVEVVGGRLVVAVA